MRYWYYEEETTYYLIRPQQPKPPQKKPPDPTPMIVAACVAGIGGFVLGSPISVQNGVGIGFLFAIVAGTAAFFATKQ